MPNHPIWPGHPAPAAERVTFSYFDVAGEPFHQQLLAWRGRVGHVMDVLPLRDQLAQPFRGAIARYDAGGIAFTDCVTDTLQIERTIARISRDSVRSFAFHIFLSGGTGILSGRRARRTDAAVADGILGLDMDQPVRMIRHACRVITLFVSGQVLEDLLVDPATIHGRAIGADVPIARLIIERCAALAGRIRHMPAAEAGFHLRAIVRLLAEAYGRQAGLLGNARAVERAQMYGQVLRHIRHHLHEAELSPDSVLDALGLARPSVYRLFQHEGGLARYIQRLRLRLAAHELVAFPQIPVKDIAYACGFKTPSDFSRAFRRAYEMTPQELRMPAAPV